MMLSNIGQQIIDVPPNIVVGSLNTCYDLPQYHWNDEQFRDYRPEG